MRRQRQRCQALDVNGKQCSAKMSYPAQYFGSDMYDSSWLEPTWVRVWLCERHVGKVKP